MAGLPTFPTVIFPLSALPASTTTLTGDPIRLIKIFLTNTTVATITVTLTDGNGTVLAQDMRLSPNMPAAPFGEFCFMFWDGLIITPSAVGLNCQVEGYANVQI